MNKPLIFCGRPTHKLARAVCQELDLDLTDPEFERFADGEPWVRIENHAEIKNRNVVLIQSTQEYAPNTYFDLFGLLSIFRRYDPKSVTLVLPFMGFRRQERDLSGGEAIMAELMAEFIGSVGVDQVILCDPHSPKQQDYFEKFGVAVRLIDPNPLFLNALGGKSRQDMAVITPDKGRNDASQCFAELLGVPLINGFKVRRDHDEVSQQSINGHVLGKICLIREDEISTAGTIVATTEELMKNGAKEIIVLATHGVLAGGAVQKLKRAGNVSEVLITDSIYLPWEKRIGKIKVVSLAPLIAETIQEFIN